jgi:hypothetical protein
MPIFLDSIPQKRQYFWIQFQINAYFFGFNSIKKAIFLDLIPNKWHFIGILVKFALKNS